MVNSIHWKLSSKTDKVIVREPLTSQDARIYIVVAGQSKKALGSARYISENLCELEQEHELLCPSVEVTVGNSQGISRGVHGASVQAALICRGVCQGGRALLLYRFG